MLCAGMHRPVFVLATHSGLQVLVVGDEQGGRIATLFGAAAGARDVGRGCCAKHVNETRRLYRRRRRRTPYSPAASAASLALASAATFGGGVGRGARRVTPASSGTQQCHTRQPSTTVETL
jgi:hypothetical protein